ncbi:MAG TPA: hypothetical protein VK996_08925 [Ramlibacter sp.]|nr:hypothetical protein [Ramlibacter sp.]
MIQDDQKKPDPRAPDGQDGSGNGTRSGSGADTAFKEMLKKRQMRHNSNDDPQEPGEKDSRPSPP